MDASFMSRRHLDTTALDAHEPFSPTSITPTKRRHLPPFHTPTSSSTPPPPSSVTFRPPPPPSPLLKLSSGETLFRILCPATKTGRVIGKGGANIRHFREETGAKIRIDDSAPACDERVITIIADSTRRDCSTGSAPSQSNSDCASTTAEHPPSSSIDDEASPAQLALVRVFERIWKVDEEREGEERKDEGSNSIGGIPQGMVVCRLLAPTSLVGCVLGRGGKIVERIRNETGAQVRVLPKDQIPHCASQGDEVIQITGNFSAVRRALLSVSGCLQDNPRAELAYSSTPKSSGSSFHGNGLPGPDPYSLPGYATGHQFVDHHSKNFQYSCAESSASYGMVKEEEVVFRLLCKVDKVGSLIGKGGSIIRVIESETGASIKIVEVASDSDERAVIISSRENSEQRHSPAQEAVIRVHSRIAEIGFEPAAAVVARLLVHSNQMGYVFGDGGIPIAELRRVTGASIRIFPMEQSPRFGSQGDEVVQVIGSLQSVQDVLFQVTSRLRETVFTLRPKFPTATSLPHRPEMLPPAYRARHEPASPAYHPPPSIPRGVDHGFAPRRPFERASALTPHGFDHHCPTYPDSVPNLYGNERRGQAPIYDQPISPRCPTQASGAPAADVNGGFAPNDARTSSEDAVVQSPVVVEVMIPQYLLKHVYGADNSNLDFIRQASGAKVSVTDPRPGTTEGVVVLSGTQDQTRTAQNLVHACILSELPF
ncbi:PREDICTED: KH domain-containing protein HEN4 [Ipomoea nil]|uniref:KH domain-containing protein HEN4 n=1 Tax=Ipomoea nil TaxID=35883 RepID=UPI0009008741|nr:PREDICTED: KH domain-containing protein HEN4 [Ipomoea nil]